MNQIRPTTRTALMPRTTPDPVEVSPLVASRALAEFIDRHPQLMILTGAGVSTDSGIPDYRDATGAWKRRPPVQHQAFMSQYELRQRYWARSLLGWPAIRNAMPNDAHNNLAALEQAGRTGLLVTQNVDRLHQKAGSQRVVDLHGRADQVICMSCGARSERDEVHQRCVELNPDFAGLVAPAAPDGDADLETDFSGFRLAGCARCDGILKPDVVFFGDFVPTERVNRALEYLEEADALLVVGSSLMVYSGLRFCRKADALGKPLAALNLGRTRADAMLTLRLNARITETLSLCRQLLA